MFYSWFAVKRTLPRGGRYKLSRFYNLNGFEKFATVRLLQLPTCLSVATGKQGCRKGSFHGTFETYVTLPNARRCRFWQRQGKLICWLFCASWYFLCRCHFSCIPKIEVRFLMTASTVAHRPRASPPSWYIVCLLYKRLAMKSFLGRISKKNPPCKLTCNCSSGSHPIMQGAAQVGLRVLPVRKWVPVGTILSCTPKAL